MTKQELIKKYKEIVLNTNGGNDDYVVALCQIGSAINELDEQNEQITELNQQLRQQLEVQKNKSELVAENEAMKDTIAIVLAQKSNTSKHNQELRKEIKQLKQSQNQKAIEILQEVKEKFGYKNNSQLVISSKHLCDFIDNQINECKNKKDC